ncbi:MAG: hypothetical protein IJ187_00935 [Neisseriaceae bacterium]|nr:hypothetical protein [Neisseriaceae bacterium]
MEIMEIIYIKVVAMVILAIGVWFEVNYECNKKRTDLLLAVFFIVFSVCIWAFPTAMEIVKILQAI